MGFMGAKEVFWEWLDFDVLGFDLHMGVCVVGILGFGL